MAEPTSGGLGHAQCLRCGVPIAWSRWTCGYCADMDKEHPKRRSALTWPEQAE